MSSPTVSDHREKTTERVSGGPVPSCLDSSASDSATPTVRSARGDRLFDLGSPVDLCALVDLCSLPEPCAPVDLPVRSALRFSHVWHTA